jgi:hypothetical protein
MSSIPVNESPSKPILKDQPGGMRSVGFWVIWSAEITSALLSDKTKTEPSEGLSWFLNCEERGFERTTEGGLGVTQRDREECAESDVSGSVALTMMRGVPSSSNAGLPLIVRVSESNESQAGRAEAE